MHSRVMAGASELVRVSADQSTQPLLELVEVAPNVLHLTEQVECVLTLEGYS